MFNSQNNNSQYQNDVPPNPKANSYPGKFFKKLGGLGIGIAALIFAAFLGLNSIYTINEQEQAVLVTLGQATSVTTPGLHFKIPFLQKVIDRKSVV